MYILGFLSFPFFLWLLLGQVIYEFCVCVRLYAYTYFITFIYYYFDVEVGPLQQCDMLSALVGIFNVTSLSDVLLLL